MIVLYGYSIIYKIVIMALTAYKEFWSEFIEIYHSLPCLWNTKDENYNNRHIRKLALRKLVKKLQEVEPEASEDSVKRKINTFRSNFNREVRKMRLSERKQSNEIYNPTLWYFDHLSFLLNQEKYNKNGVSMDCQYDEDMTMMGLSNTKHELMIKNEGLNTESINQDDITDDGQSLHNEKFKKTKLRFGNKNNNRNKLAEPLIEYTPVFEVLKGNTTPVQESITEPQNLSSPENHLNRLENTSDKSIESEKTCFARKLNSNQKRLKLRLKSHDPYNKFQFKNIEQSEILTDEAAIYGQAWACGFRKLSPQQQLFAKKAIDDILVLGQLKALKLSTVHIKANLLDETSDQG